MFSFHFGLQNAFNRVVPDDQNSFDYEYFLKGGSSIIANTAAIINSDCIHF